MALKKLYALACALALSICSQSLVRARHSFSNQSDTSKQPSPFVLPILKRDSLLNGLQLIVMEQPGAGSITARLRINSGAMFDLSNKGGLANLTAGMLLRGGGGLSAKYISETIDQSALRVNITVGWDATDLSISGAAGEFETIFDLLGRLVISPAFDQKELDALKSERVAAIKSEQSDDAEAVRRKAIEVVFGTHPFGHPVVGTAESVAQITRQDLSYFHNKFYLANNSQLLVWGDVTAEQVTRVARARLGSWKKGERVPPSFRPPELGQSRRVIIIDRADGAAGHAAIAQVGLTRRADDYFAGMVVSDLLGRLNSDYAAKNPGTTFETEIDPRMLPGPLLVKIKSTPEQIAAAVNATIEAMTALQSTLIDIEQVEAAKARLIASMSERLRTPEGAASVILEIETYGLGRDYLLNFAQRVKAITPADVQQAARNLLKPQSVTTVITGPAIKLEGQLKKMGVVTVVR